MGITLTFEITFRSNYHVGAGYGKGFNVDSAILRDADGTPVLRGTMLAGLLRNGAYRLLKFPFLREKYDEEDVLKRLFGSPKQAKRWHISSARPKEALAEGRDSQAVQRVRIDPRTRRAEPRKLFSQEEGLAGQVFRFTAICPDTDETVLDEAALLVAAARNVRQLGRSRRRGLGECLIRLTDVEGISETPDDWQDWFLEQFNNKWMQNEPAERLATPRQKIYTIGDQRLSEYHDKPLRLRLIVRLDEPLLIACRAPAGSHFETRESIPGSVILGALADKAAHQNDLTDLQTYAQFVSLFLRGGVYFPTLYPAYLYRNNLYPTIPAPLGLLTCSLLPFSEYGDGHGTYMARKHKCPECRKKNVDSHLEPVSNFVILRRLGDSHVLVPSRSSELHIQVDEESGRVKKGQLYGYTVLNAGQYFVGELICSSEEAWNHLREMADLGEKTPLTWRIGKARRRGYGKVTAWLEACDDKPPLWIQLPLAQRVLDPKQHPQQRLSLTLLTDTIITNRWRQQAVGFSEDWLEEVLGLGPVRIEDAYARMCVVDSFNTHLGLPRWRDTALAAGSVVWFTLESPPDNWQERMETLEIQGIGLRRNEGFGRVAFNHPVYDQRDKLTRSNIRLNEAMRLEGGHDQNMFMERWEKELDGLLPKKLDPRFAALARWLYTNSDMSPAELLDYFGAEFTQQEEGKKDKRVELKPTPDRVLGEPNTALIEAIGGKSEYGDRSKDNFFLGEGKEVMIKICEALEELEGKDKQHWAEGIQHLADRIAALAREEKGESQ